MFQSTESGAQASTALPVYTSVVSPTREPVRHLLFGTPHGVQMTIKHLHRLGYAEPNDWSKLMSTGRSGEVMAILTKHVTV